MKVVGTRVSFLLFARKIHVDRDNRCIGVNRQIDTYVCMHKIDRYVGRWMIVTVIDRWDG